jgi:predicted flap endonuclease-1-like 5' DNA nuclease
VYGSESVGGSQSAVQGNAVQDSSPSAASEDAQPQSAKADVDAKTDEGSGDSDSHDDEPRDDLMAIKGIGPALQNRLYAFQIRTYADLANLDAQGIEKLERQLDDNSELDVSAWVAQAKELEKYQ